MGHLQKFWAVVSVIVLFNMIMVIGVIVINQQSSFSQLTIITLDIILFLFSLVGSLSAARAISS